MNIENVPLSIKLTYKKYASFKLFRGKNSELFINLDCMCTVIEGAL